jgi:hypothetical protein
LCVLAIPPPSMQKIEPESSVALLLDLWRSCLSGSWIAR